MLTSLKVASQQLHFQTSSLAVKAWTQTVVHLRMRGPYMSYGLNLGCRDLQGTL